jgi:hypothetical protein
VTVRSEKQFPREKASRRLRLDGIEIEFNDEQKENAHFPSLDSLDRDPNMT